MATALEIVNQALYRVGQGAITSGEFTTPTTETARVASASWPFVRREVLRSHSWNVVTQREKLRPLDEINAAYELSFDFASVFPLPTDCLRVLECDTESQWRVERGPIGTGTVVGTNYASTQPVITANIVNVTTSAVHGLAVGDLVYLTDAVDTELQNVPLRVTGVPSTTQFQMQNVSTSGLTGGASATGFVVKLDEGPVVVSDAAGEMGVLYLRDIEDPSSFDSILTDALVLRMAVEFAERVTNSRTRRESLLAEYMALVEEARSLDSAESSPMEFEEDPWITVRY